MNSFYNRPVLTVVIQAGGQSSRMGEDKALKNFLGRPLIERVIGRVSPLADEVIVTTNQPAGYGFLNVQLAQDVKPDRGPLGGLYTALAAAKTQFVAVVACDMPFVSVDLLEGARQLLVQKAVDVVIPRIGEDYQPFHAVYRREVCLPAIESAIDSDQWRVISWLPLVKVLELSSDEVRTFDPSELCFWNLNTPDEFARAEGIASAQ